MEIVKIGLITSLDSHGNFSVIYLENVSSLQIFLSGNKKAIRRKWLNKEHPSVSDWIEIIKEIHLMERITFFIETG